MARREVRKSAVVMTGLRPRVSERVPATSIPRARATVENDSGRLDMAGDTPNSRANSGSRGCTS